MSAWVTVKGHPPHSRGNDFIEMFTPEARLAASAYAFDL